MRYFPVFLDLQEKKSMVIGGGRVAERKAQNLLKAGARVTVVAPQITPALRRLKEKGKIKHHPRLFRSGDLKGAYLVIAATDDRQTNERIFRLASGLRIPVNVVDDPLHCSFIVPSIISRGDIFIAISTGGQSPVLAQALREKLQKEIGPEYDFLLKILGSVRKKILPMGGGARKNRRIFRLLVGQDLLRLIRGKKSSALEARVGEIIGSRFQLKDLGLKL